jgi:hypothetical protein
MSHNLLSVLSFARAGTKAGKAAHRAAVMDNVRTAAAAVAAHKDFSAVADTRYTLGDTVKYGTGKGKVDPVKALAAGAAGLNVTVDNLSKVKAWRVQAVIGALRFVECILRTAGTLTDEQYTLIEARLISIDDGKPKESSAPAQAEQAEQADTAGTEQADTDGTDGTEQADTADTAGTVSQAEFDAMRIRAEQAENNAQQTGAALEKANATIAMQADELIRLYAAIEAIQAAQVETIEAKPVRTGGKRKASALMAAA